MSHGEAALDAANGALILQVCRDCAAVQYPRRDACYRCLSLKLERRPCSGAGELLAETRIWRSYDPLFAPHLPWRIGTVQLDAGPVIIAHLHRAVTQAPVRVRLASYLDKISRSVLVAFPAGQSYSLVDDERLQHVIAE